MRSCKNCSGTWNNPMEKPGEEIKCPFCGFIVEEAKKDDSMKGRLHAILVESEYKILTKGTRISAILTDYFPKEKRELGTIKTALESGVGNHFYTLTQNASLNVVEEITRIRKVMMDEAWMSETASDFVCELFLHAIDQDAAWEAWKQSKAKPVAAPVTPTPVAQPTSAPQPVVTTPAPKMQPTPAPQPKKNPYDDLNLKLPKLRLGLTLGVVKLEEGAAKGDSSDMYCLGRTYENCRGVANDYNRMITWYTKAADAGYTDAYQRLYVVTGKKEHLTKGYTLGNAKCIFEMGNQYLQEPNKNRTLAEENFKRAVPTIEKEAEGGDEISQEMLARSFFFGLGRDGKADIERARIWYMKAAQQGNPVALGAMVRFREKLGFALVTIERVFRDLQHSTRYRTVHLLGSLYYELGHPYEESRTLFERAVEHGCFGNYGSFEYMCKAARTLRDQNTKAGNDQAAKVYMMITDHGKYEKEAHQFLAGYYKDDAEKSAKHLKYASQIKI